jgi:hypothetical protein
MKYFYANGKVINVNLIARTDKAQSVDPENTDTQDGDKIIPAPYNEQTV